MSENPFFNPDDFRSVELTIVLINQSTKTQVRGNIRSVGDLSPDAEGDTVHPIQLIEFLEKGVSLEAPGRTCATGHLVMVEIHISNAKDLNLVSFSAKVESTQKIDSERDAISLTLLQYDQKTWKQFVTLFANRQLEIQNFFEAAKGY